MSGIQVSTLSLFLCTKGTQSASIVESCVCLRRQWHVEFDETCHSAISAVYSSRILPAALFDLRKRAAPSCLVQPSCLRSHGAQLWFQKSPLPHRSMATSLHPLPGHNSILSASTFFKHQMLNEADNTG